MPNREPVSLAGQRYTLRHIGPRAAVFPSTPTANLSLLARSDIVARRLPSSDTPSGPDFCSGSWTTRLGDSGEATLTFPNTISSDGVPWRARFDPAGHLQFVEISDNGEIDFAGVIDQLPQVDPQQVQVHCSDGWWLLKKAYERDWTVVHAPRDIIERATQLWVPAIADNFPAGGLTSQWTASMAGGGSVTPGASGGEQLALTASSGENATITSQTVTVTATGTWRASVAAQNVTLATGSDLQALVTESGGETYGIQLWHGFAYFLWDGTVVGQVQLSSAPSYGFLLESDGQWTWAFVNGMLVGGVRRGQTSTTSIAVQVKLFNGGTVAAATATIAGVLLETMQPFLQRGSDKGDWVLPGSASTYPSGGLHARYFNDADLQNDANRPVKIMHPSRTQAYAGGGVAEYQNQQDPQISGQSNPTPGAAASNWSCQWYGSIYLKLSAGNYSLKIVTTQGGAFRVWIGKTQFGSQLADNWPVTPPFPSPTTVTFTLTASTLAGSLPYGAGSVTRDGWYPIKVEFAKDGIPGPAPTLSFQPPAGYTDPGGTALTGGTMIAVPATSLSPLGCVDQRYQGVSHFDLAQQTAQAYNYQASVEPQTLDSGLFPGVLAPRIREGHDTDIILKPDRNIRRDGEGVLNYSSTLDASDTASSLQGNGAGLQNGSIGQLQAMVYDPPTMLGSLFDVQAWTDFSDAAFPELLAASLNAKLGLQLSPWQALSADPVGRARWTNTWPLPGALAKMRWRPGDGLQIQAAEINVWDTAPRQMLVVTRQITPKGATQTQATFANRPRTGAHTLKQQLYKATRWQRNYQRQIVTLSGTYIGGPIANSIAASSLGPLSLVQLSPADQIVRVRLRIAFNTNSVPFGIVVNSIEVTNVFNGGTNGSNGFTAVPINLDITSVATTSTSAQTLNVQLKNYSATTASQFDYQLLVDVVR